LKRRKTIFEVRYYIAGLGGKTPLGLPLGSFAVLPEGLKSERKKNKPQRELGRVDPKRIIMEKQLVQRRTQEKRNKKLSTISKTCKKLNGFGVGAALRRSGSR